MNTFKIELSQLNLRKEEGFYLGKLQIATSEFHVYAIEVTSDGDGGYVAVNPEMESTLDALYEESGDSLSTVEIDGVKHIMTMIPYSE